MLILSLFRHAKSGWDDPRLKDHDRPLAPRGIDAAPRMGAYMLSTGLVPDLVLSSSSVRTRETCKLAFAAFPKPPEVRIEKSLYLASPATMLRLACGTADGVRHLMLVGHNPGLHALALDLVAGGDRDAMARLAEKLPTAALVAIRLPVTRWHDVRGGSGQLLAFVTPRLLPD